MIKYRNGIWLESRKCVLNSIVPTNHICHSNKLNARDRNINVIRALRSATRSTTSSCQFRSYDTHSEPIHMRCRRNGHGHAARSIPLDWRQQLLLFRFYSYLWEWQSGKRTISPHFPWRTCAFDAYVVIMHTTNLCKWIHWMNECHLSHLGLMLTTFSFLVSTKDFLRAKLFGRFLLDDKYFLSRFRTPMRSDASRFTNSTLLCNCNKLC